MGILDMLGGVLGQSQGQTAPAPGVAQVLTQLIAGQGYGNQGGLGGLVNQFRQAGLGHVAESWVRPGPNQPVAPDQLRQVFGDEQVETMADDAGMPTDSFLSQLSQHLPRAVDGVTPNGQMPEEGTISV